MFNKIINLFLIKYTDVSYEIRGKARIFLTFDLILIPILLLFLLLLNRSLNRDIFDNTNLILVGFIIVSSLSLVLLKKGLYNPAANMMSILLLIGNFFIANHTISTGSVPRFIASNLTITSITIFSVLFCKKKVFFSIFVLSILSVCLNILVFSPVVFFKKGEIASVLGALLLTLTLTTILSYFILRITDQARKLRKGDNDLERNKQIDINKNLLESLVNASKKMDSSSQNLSHNSTSFSENMQNQAATIEEMTATIEEVSAGAENVRISAEKQSALMISLISRMNELSGITKDMEDRISSTIHRTEDISDQAQSGEKSVKVMNTSMGEINNTSKEMTNILSIINDISDQINLLSLNAAIEAARAGESGRGFAVVADEIGKLAEQTSTSVKNIDSLIKQSEDEVNKGMAKVQDTVSTISDIINGVNEISGMINMVSKYMGKHIKSNQEVNIEAENAKNRSEEINIATQEQKKAAEEITRAITNINQISQANTTGAEEISNLSKDISSMAQDLNDKISYYSDEQS